MTRRAWLRSRRNRRSNGWRQMVEWWARWDATSVRLAMVGTAVGFDDAALLNFLANRWLETHTPLFNPCPHRYTLPTIKPSNLPFNSKVIILAIVDLTVVLTALPHIGLHDKPAFSPAARVNIRSYSTYPQLWNHYSSAILMLDTTNQHCPLETPAVRLVSVTLPRLCYAQLTFPFITIIIKLD